MPEPARNGSGQVIDQGAAADPGMPVASDPASPARALSLAMQPSPTGQGATATELDSETLRLLERFLTGAVLFGSDELLERLRHWQAGNRSHRWSGGDIDAGSAPSQADLVRYFVIGSMSWGRRQAIQAAYAGFQLSVNRTKSLRGMLNAVTDNWLLRPLRQSVDDTSATLAREIALRIQEGQRVGASEPCAGPDDHRRYRGRLD